MFQTKLTEFAILSLLLAAGLSCSGDPVRKAATHVENGKRLLAANDAPRAAIEFRNAVKLQPQNAEATYHLGLASLEQGSIQEAVSAFRRATLLNPNLVDARVRLASLELRSGNKQVIEDAEKQARAAVAKDASHAEGALVLATAELQLGKVDEGMKRLEETVARFPKHLNSAVMLARHRISQKDYAGAEEILQRAAREAPESAEPRIALGHFHGALSRFSDAERDFRGALGIEPGNGRAMAGLASALIALQRPGDADPVLRHLSSLPGREFKPYYAMYLYQTGKRAEATAEFERLHRADPADTEARTQLVAAYMETGRMPEARRLIADALAKNPKDIPALEFHARILLLDNQVEEAQRSVGNMLRYDPRSGTAHYLQAKIHQAKGAGRSYQGELNEALTLQPTLLAARVELSQYLRQTGAPKAALEALDGTPAEQRGALEAVVERNWVLLALGDEVGARAGISTALQAVRTPDLLVQLALLNLKTRNPAEARRNAEEALGRNPEDARALVILADTFVAVNQPAAARQSVKQAVERRPGAARLQFAGGHKLLSLGDRDSARAAFDASARAASADFAATPRLALAELDIVDGHLDAARQTLNAVLAADAANLGAHLLLGELEHKQGNAAAAVEHFRKAVETEGTPVAALNNLAYLLLEAGKNQEALKYAQRAKELAPHNAAIDDTLGWIYYQLGVYPSAVRHLESAVMRESTAVRNYHLAMAYFKLGSAGRASTTLQTARRMDPNLPEARQAAALLAR